MSAESAARCMLALRLAIEAYAVARENHARDRGSIAASGAEADAFSAVYTRIGQLETVVNWRPE